MPAPLFDRLAPLRSDAEMTAHIAGIIRNFSDHADRLDTAEELIDRAERRGAITAETAATLRETFEIDPVPVARRA